MADEVCQLKYTKELIIHEKVFFTKFNFYCND